jgi:bifunctional DNase/RNase
MTEMVLNKIRIDEKSDGQVIVLKEKNPHSGAGGARYLPIIIGISEVAAIKRNLSGQRPARPMTHDLLANVIYELGARLEKVIINKIEANTFYAKLVLKLKDSGRQRTVMIDARPSDSIALAVRVEAPIFVEEEVFETLQKYEGQIF